MSLLVDPRICPDCRSALDPARACTGCGLVLRGADASELWTLLLRADALVARLRLAPAPASSTPPAPSLTARLPQAPVAPVPASPPRAADRGVSSLSVQNVLLGVGGLCVLVAAAVFVAVTWSSLGLAGRTLVMTAVTAAIGVVAAILTRRGLRGGAETLWLLTAALVGIDVVAARVAGLAGDLDPRHGAGLLGLILLTGATSAYTWASGRPQLRLAGMVGVAGLGTLALTAAEAWSAPQATVATAAAVPVLISAGLVTGRVLGGRLVAIGYAVGAVGIVSWGLLFFQGLDRVGATSTEWWQHLRGWPLLAAALWAAAPSVVRRLPEPIRYAAATASLVSLVTFALGARFGQNDEVLLASGLALSLSIVTALAPLVWARPAAVMTSAAAIAGSMMVVVRPFGVLDTLTTTGAVGSANLGERLPASTWTLAWWTAPLIAVVVALTALSLVRHLSASNRATGLGVWRVVAPVLAGTGLATVLLEQRPHLLLVVGVWAALAALAGLVTYLGRTTALALVSGLGACAYVVGLGLRFATPSHLLVALFATLVAAVLAAAASRSRHDGLEGVLIPVLVGPAVLLTGFAATHWPYAAHATGDTAALALVLTMVAIGLGAAKVGRTPAGRITIESAALAGALVAPFLATDRTIGALALTIAGSAVALSSILHRDRDQLSWLAVILLSGATLLRLAEHAVAPEVYAVPAAVLLGGAGVWRLIHDRGTTSWRALGSSLSLGLVPSLLLALDNPVSTRGALIGAAGVVVLSVGIARRWGAPFVAGSAVVAVLAVRHLGPLAAALPRWFSLGWVGLALLLVGITWEARRRDAAMAERYLTALR